MVVIKNKWIDVEVEGVNHPRICVRSYFKEESGADNYCVVQFGWNIDDHFTTRYKTLTVKELRNILGAKPKEKIIIKEN